VSIVWLVRIARVAPENGHLSLWSCTQHPGTRGLSTTSDLVSTCCHIAVKRRHKYGYVAASTRWMYGFVTIWAIEL